MKPLKKGSGGRRRSSKNVFTTKSGKTFKVHRSITDRLKARRDARAKRKAAYLSTLPKNRIKRILYRLHPKRMAKYWFSREGGIMALKLLGIGIVAGFLLLVGVFAYFRKDLPNLKDISGNNIGGSIRYYDKTGETLLWEDYDAAKRIPVRDEEISQDMKDATIAIEDKDFFKHGGFDVRGITRAAFNNVFGGGDSQQGGSTITQQLVKLTQDWTKDVTYTRKIKELILAIELERSYSKQEILTGYLNTAPYGGIEYGVEAAARDYFQKSAKDLTLAESALLAAIPKSPRYYSPYSGDFDKEATIGRQHYILDQMVEQGMVSREEAEEAKKVDIVATVKPRLPKYDGIKAPWFVLAAKEQLEERFGAETVQRGGWKVITTLDMNMQQIAEEEVSEGLSQVRRQGGDSAAFVAEDVKTGQVVALVGGADFTNPEFGQNNYARLRLPPGSSFKPYDYTALMEHTENFGAGSVLYDTQGPLEGYPCTNKAQPKNGGNCLHNYDFRYPGPITLRYALGGSRNVPAVKAMLIAGVDKTIETAEKLGLESGYKCYEDEQLTKESQCYASSAIGDGAYLKLDEHVHGYATLSRNGLNIPRTYILKIEDANGKTVDEWKPSKGEQAVRPETAYIVADMMSDPRASYFSQKIHSYKGHKYSIKTGTTNDAKDGLLMGFSTHYAAGVWVGYHNRQVEMRGFMETMTRPIWKGWMDRVHDNLQPEERQRPSGIQSLPAFVVRNHVGTGSIEPSPSTDLYPSWYKQKSSKPGQKQIIDIISNKLATDCTPERAKKEVDNADATNFSGDIFVTGQGANTSERDDVHNCSDQKPGISLSAPASCNGSCTFTATVSQGTHPLGGNGDKGGGKVNFKIDGQIVQSYDIAGPGSVSLTYKPDFSGSRQVTAEVVDSVLYDASDSATVAFTASSSGLNAVSPADGAVVANRSAVEFEWNSLGFGITYTVTWSCPGKNESANVSTTSYNPNNSDLATGNCSWSVKASNGAASGTNFFTISNP